MFRKPKTRGKRIATTAKSEKNDSYSLELGRGNAPSRSGIYKPFKIPSVLSRPGPGMIVDNKASSSVKPSIPRRRMVQKKNLPETSGSRPGFVVPSVGTVSVLEVNVDVLREQKCELDREIKRLESQGYRAAEVPMFIDLLHKYNELKDAAQEVFGKLALVRGCLIKDIYREMKLNPED